MVKQQKQNTFLVWVGRCLLIGLAVYGLVYVAASPRGEQENRETPSPLSTENWKSYTSADYGFSFKYPPELAYEGQEIQADAQQGEVIDEAAGHTVYSAVLTKDLNAFDISEGIGLSIVKRENNAPTFPTSETIPGLFSEKEIIIGGQSGRQYSYDSLAFLNNGTQTDSARNVRYVVEHNGYIYDIGSFGADEYYSNVVEVLIPTLRFK